MKGFCASSAASYRVWLYLKKTVPYGLRSEKRKHLMAMTTALDIRVAAMALRNCQEKPLIMTRATDGQDAASVAFQNFEMF